MTLLESMYLELLKRLTKFYLAFGKPELKYNEICSRYIVSDSRINFPLSLKNRYFF